MLSHRARFAGVVGISLIALAGSASADPIVKDLGGGWEVTIFDPDHLDFVTDAVVGDTLVIQKFAEFTSVDEFTGEPTPLLATFRQTNPDASTATKIVITDEVIINETGLDWVCFRMVLVDHGQATWNPDASADFSIDPFQDRVYRDGNTEVEFFDGVVANNSTWTPGFANGGLQADINLGADDPVTFTLKEIPTIPSPGAMALAAIGGLLAAARRRR